MGLRSKIAALIFLLLSAFGGLAYLLTHYTIEKTLGQLEQDTLVNDGMRIRNAFVESMNQLRVKGVDWAAWDASYAFIQGKNPEYIKGLAAPQTFAAMRVNDVIYLNLKLEKFFETAFDFEALTVKSVDPDFERGLRAYLNQNPLTPDIPRDGKMGIIQESGRLFVVVFFPITSTDWLQPTAGYMIWSRHINAIEEARIAELVRYPTQVEVITDLSSFQNPETIRQVEDVYVLHLDFQQSRLSMVFRDFTGKPVMALHTSLPRNIHQLGLNMEKAIVTLCAVISLLVVAAVIILVNRMVVSPVTAMAHQVSRIEQLEDGAQISVECQNELKVLRDAMNTMLRSLKESTDQINLQQQQLIQSAKMASLGEMAGGIAHEINNPLAIITGFANIIERQCQNGKIEIEVVRRHAAHIQTSVERITKIIKGLRSFSREGSSDPFVVTPLASILDDVCDLCLERLKNEDVFLWIDREMLQRVNPQISCRATQIAQVLLNLISNAVDAIQSLPYRWIRISFEDQLDVIRIRVTDCGSGIPSDLVQKIFQPFFTTKDIGKGTGLGLSISKGIVEAHYGRLYVDAEQPNTCFVVELPKKHPEDHKIPSTPKASHG